MSDNPYAPPAAAVEDSRPPAVIARPRVTTIGVRLLCTVLVCKVVFGVYGQYRMFATYMFGVDLTAYAPTIAVFVVYYLACFALLPLAARGRNAARIGLAVLVVFDGARIIWSWRHLLDPSDYLIVGLVYLPTAVIPILVLSMQFWPASNAWYAAIREANRS